MTLKFSAASHRYWLDGKPVPGVTTLIKGGIPAPALVYWSAKSVAEYVADNEDAVAHLRTMDRGPMVAALKAVPWAARDKAGARGTDVHDLGEKLVHGLEVEVPEHLTGYVEGYARFLDLWQPTPVLTECSVGNRQHWYAGRFDLIADLDGVRWLLDLKTAKGVYGDNALQTDAYRNAEFYVVDGDPDTELPMPEGIERLGVIHIRDDGTDLVPLESNGQPFRDFLHAAWTSKREKDRKGYVGDPMAHHSQTEGAA
jgi:hypothetical protein